MDHEEHLLQRLHGEPGWEPFDAPGMIGGSLRFVSGDRTGTRFRMRYFRDQNGNLVARVCFGPDTEGPPNHAHGGSIAAVLDEVLGLAAWAAGHPAVVGNLNVRFRKLLPLGRVVQTESRVIAVQDRKVTVQGRIVGLNDTLYAEAEAVCVKIEPLLAESSKRKGPG